MRSCPLRQRLSSWYERRPRPQARQSFFLLFCSRLQYPEQHLRWSRAVNSRPYAISQAQMGLWYMSFLPLLLLQISLCRVGRQRLTALPQQVFTHPPSKPDLQLSLYPAFRLFLKLFSAVNFIMTFFANYKSFSIHFRHHKNPIGYMPAPFSVFLLNVF